MSPPSRRFACRRLKLAAAVLVGAVAFAAPGVAADMPIKAPDVVVVPPPLWSGVYFGLHGGWGWARTQIKDPDQGPLSVHPAEQHFPDVD
jgi:outer membrane immunogenic protein